MKRILLTLISCPLFLNANPLQKCIMQIQSKQIGSNAYQAIIPGGPKNFVPFVAKLTTLTKQHPKHTQNLLAQLQVDPSLTAQSRLEILTTALHFKNPK